MTVHDPREHIRGIHQILISDKKRIGFLFGAGTSFATGLPDHKVPAIAPMTRVVVEHIIEQDSGYADAINEIKAELGEENFTIESLLSNIESKQSVLGSGRLNGLDHTGFARMSCILKEKVVDLVSLHLRIEAQEYGALSHYKLAQWVSKARRRYPVELFTTNYDFLFEIALEQLGMPYFDGFSGGYQPFFCPEAVEDMDAYRDLVKLWKLHGSIGWKYRDQDGTVIRDSNTPGGQTLIYPSHLKYNSTKKQPYVGLIDRLCAFLQQDDAVLFTCGYSYGDNHINERIATSLRRGANSHVYAMYFDEIYTEGGVTQYSLANGDDRVLKMAENETGGKMSVLGRRHAVIGGRFGEWRLRSEPQKDESVQVSEYFDEDAAIPQENDKESQGDECWNGTGTFLLPDFVKFSSFMGRLSSNIETGNLR